jgi:hypothetical protein
MCKEETHLLLGALIIARLRSRDSFNKTREILLGKLLYQHKLFGHQRFIGQIDIGGMPFAKVTQAIELLGTEVALVVRREMAKAGQA